MDSFEFPTENSTLNSEYLEKICSGSECLPTVILLRDDHSVCIYIYFLFYFIFFCWEKMTAPQCLKMWKKCSLKEWKPWTWSFHCGFCSCWSCLVGRQRIGFGLMQISLGNNFVRAGTVGYGWDRERRDKGRWDETCEDVRWQKWHLSQPERKQFWLPQCKMREKVVQSWC